MLQTAGLFLRHILQQIFLSNVFHWLLILLLRKRIGSDGQEVHLASQESLQAFAANLTAALLNSSSLHMAVKNWNSSQSPITLQIILQGPNVSYHPMINFNYGGSYFNEDNSTMSLGYGPTFGPTNGLMFGPTIGDTYGPSFGSTLGNTFGVMFGPSIGPTIGPSYGPTVGATYGPSFGSTFGNTIGPSYGATYGSTYGPSYGATYGKTVGPSYGATYGPTYGPSYGATYGGVSGPSYGATYNLGPTLNGTIDTLAKIPSAHSFPANLTALLQARSFNTANNQPAFFPPRTNLPPTNLGRYRMRRSASPVRISISESFS